MEKTIKKFNLSEKIDRTRSTISYGHVRKFIRLLKEELERGVKRNNVFPLDWCFDSIDKLAGEKLTNGI